MAQEGAERRAHPRIEAELEAHLICPIAEDAIAVVTRNVSCSGLYCRVPRHIPASTRMAMAIILPVREAGHVHNRLLQLEGVVVRIDPEQEEVGRKDYRIALYFPTLTREARAVIGRYVRQHSEG